MVSLRAEKAFNGTVQVTSMVEKPDPKDAPSNLAVIGRYILTPRIFEHLGKKRKGAGGEIQLTDAMSALLQEQPIFGYKLKGSGLTVGIKPAFSWLILLLHLSGPN